MASRTTQASTGRARRPSPVSVPFAAAGVLYLALVAYLTLGAVPWAAATNEAPGGVLSPRTWLDPGTWRSGGAAEFVANIFLFVPIGVLLRLGLRRLRAVSAVLVAVLVTVAIEVVQIPLDRVSDPRDLVANTLGALVGTALTARRRVRGPGEAARPASMRTAGGPGHSL
ncbi:hypothetical protein GC722_00120 [Auraticoccus sp. F435]|uniref:VanZ-like domain-containing protein n=1 Tax=Auraticoccus cholistanensis TaxID=2656650 RepID=A0A6A9UNL0_9ACTN|nr:VanZ family protein [Auraticoccus cholistanensis]MVA74446.1 hypothetical protein [Auraticoccus cholistanensis]